MNNIRWGLCCKFYNAPIKFRSLGLSYFGKIHQKGEGFDFLNRLIRNNLDALTSAIRYCAAESIGSFRIGSEFLPFYLHPRFGYRLEDLPDAQLILKQFSDIKQFAESNRIRLTFHPDHFVVLNSLREDVLKNSLSELEYHGEIAELLGADTVNIHAGGVYGDKKESLNRFKSRFPLLSERVRSRLTLENDDRCFTVKDLLPVCEELGIPLTYDVHHHRCLPDGLTVEEASRAAYATTIREPLFHLSSPKEGWTGPKPARHHDFIDPRDFPECWLSLGPLTVDIEAKNKEVAIKKLREDLFPRMQ